MSRWWLAIAAAVSLAWGVSPRAVAAFQVSLSSPNHPHPAKSEKEKWDVQFTGEVSLGNAFQREIGRDLIFRLTPDPGDESSGWIIEVTPKSGSPGDEFSAIATPPYHFFNQRYLDTSYGTTAKESVGMTPRQFNFVLSIADSRIAEDYVNLTIYPNQATKEELGEMNRKASKVQLGSGELRILDSHITPGKTKEDLGRIDWIKFEVRLKIQSGLTMADVVP